MKIKDEVYIRKVGEEYMAVTDSDLGVDYTRVVRLNDSAAYLLNSSGGKQFNPIDWVDLLMERYDVSHETASDDVQMLLESLIKWNIIEE